MRVVQKLRSKQKKREWLKKLYAEGLAQQREGGRVYSQQIPSGNASFDFHAANWEEEAEALLQWSTELDFGAYVENWNYFQS